jgi:hypothetical protein
VLRFGHGKALYAGQALIKATHVVFFYPFDQFVTKFKQGLAHNIFIYRHKEFPWLVKTAVLVAAAIPKLLH